MTPLDRTMPQVAKDLITTYGVSVTITRYSGAYDPTTRSIPATTATQYLVPMAPPFPFDEKYLPFTMMGAGSMYTYLAAKDQTYVPQKGDVLSYNGRSWLINAVEPLVSGTLTAAYAIALQS